MRGSEVDWSCWFNASLVTKDAVTGEASVCKWRHEESGPPDLTVLWVWKEGAVVRKMGGMSCGHQIFKMSIDIPQGALLVCFEGFRM